MADMKFTVAADEKEALEGLKKVEKGFDNVGNAAERAGVKSKLGSDKAKSGHDSVRQSIDASLTSLASMLSITTAITIGVNEMKTAWASVEGAMDRLDRKNASLAGATMGLIGPGGRLLQTSLREAISAKTQSGPIGTEEGTALIASLLKSNNELGMGAVGYLDQFKQLKGAVNLQDLAPAIGTIADLMPELLPQDVADVALLAGQNAGGFGKIGEMSKTFKQLQSLGVSNAQALELSTRAAASDQGSKAVQSVIGAMTVPESERIAALAAGRQPLTGDARLAAIYANPNQYLGASGAKIKAALAEGLPAGGDIYKQALMKDVVARTAAAAGLDPSITGANSLAAAKTGQEAAVSSAETQSQVWATLMERDAQKMVERGYAPDSFPANAARLARAGSLALMGSDDPALREFYGKKASEEMGALTSALNALKSVLVSGMIQPRSKQIIAPPQ